MTATQGPRRPAPHPAIQGTLALDFPLPSGVPAIPRPPALTLIDGGRRSHPDLVGIPAPEVWAGRFVQAVVEVMVGDRPVQQMVRWTDERVYADLSRRVRLLGLTANAGARVRLERSHVRSVHVFAPEPEIAEVAAHVRHGSRSRAVAARLEANRGRWLCTALQLG
jgi:hypothetical protein